MSNSTKKNSHRQCVNSITLPEVVTLIANKTNWEPRVRGEGFLAHCPAHEDRNPSLSVSEGHDGKILMHCFRGCSVKDICDSIGISVKDLFPPKNNRG